MARSRGGKGAGRVPRGGGDTPPLGSSRRSAGVGIQSPRKPRTTRPLESLSPAYRRRIERGLARGMTRQAARGKPPREHVIREMPPEARRKVYAIFRQFKKEQREMAREQWAKLERDVAEAKREHYKALRLLWADIMEEDEDEAA